jgi:hypothetical protein
MSHAESETQRTWGGEGLSNQRPNHPNRQEGSRSDGERGRDITLGIFGAAGPGAYIAGGILARLISDAHDRLEEVRECIEWYQQEERRQLERIADFEALQASADSEPIQSEEKPIQ